MEIAKTVANLTATPTTVSTGRDATPALQGAIRTGFINYAAGIIAALILLGIGVVKSQTGFDVQVDANGLGLVLAGLLWGALAGVIDGLRRKAADRAVAQKKEDRS